MTKKIKYVPPYEVVKGSVTFHTGKDSVVVGMTFDTFNELIKKFLRAVEVDEEWYKRTYPDVAESINAGIISSAREHFLQHGYFEGRVPRELEVDENWYIQAYEDIRKEIEAGTIKSALEHFKEYGYKEGRLPSSV